MVVEEWDSGMLVIVSTGTYHLATFVMSQEDGMITGQHVLLPHDNSAVEMNIEVVGTEAPIGFMVRGAIVLALHMAEAIGTIEVPVQDDKVSRKTMLYLLSGVIQEMYLMYS